MGFSYGKFAACYCTFNFEPWTEFHENLTVKGYVSSYYVVVVVLLFYVHGKQLRSCRDD